MTEKNGPWKTLTSNVVHKSRWLTLYKDEVIKPDGTKGTYTYIESPPFVLVVAFDGERLIMVRQYRYPLKRVIVEFAGGSIDEGETPLEAAKRELQEETGLTARHWEKIGTLQAPNLATVFLAYDLIDSGQNVMHEDGISECVRLTRAELNTMITGEELTDAKTLAALLLFDGRQEAH